MKGKKLFISLLCAALVLLLASSAAVAVLAEGYTAETEQEYDFDNWPQGSSFGWEGATLTIVHINEKGEIVDDSYTGEDKNYVLCAMAPGEELAGGANWGGDIYPKQFEVSMDLWFNPDVTGYVRIYFQNLFGSNGWDSVVFSKGSVGDNADQTLNVVKIIDGQGDTIAASDDSTKGGRFTELRDGDSTCGDIGYSKWINLKVQCDGKSVLVLVNDIIVLSYESSKLATPTVTNINTFIHNGEGGFYIDRIRLGRLTDAPELEEKQPIIPVTPDPDAPVDPDEPVDPRPDYLRNTLQSYSFNYWPKDSSFGWQGASLQVEHIDGNGDVVDAEYAEADLNYVLHADQVGTEQAGGMNWGTDVYPENSELSMSLWFNDDVYGFAKIYLPNLLGSGAWDSVVFEKGLYGANPDPSISSAYVVTGTGETIAASYDEAKGGQVPVLRDNDPENGNVGYDRWINFSIMRVGNELSVAVNGETVIIYNNDMLSKPSSSNINTYINSGAEGFYIDNICLNEITPVAIEGEASSTSGAAAPAVGSEPDTAVSSSDLPEIQ